MSVIKDQDKTFNRKNSVIRVETWIDTKTNDVVKYNLAYINHLVYGGDNGRVLGFDNSHPYPGFKTLHHCHYFGQVYENTKFTTFDDTLNRFMRHLARMKQQLGKNY